MKTKWVGVDIAATSISVASWNAEEKRSHYVGEFSNDEAGFGQMHDAVGREEQMTVVVEVTGGYELRLLSYAYQHGWGVALPNPKQVRDFAKGEGRRNKTDRADALLLVDYGAAKQPDTQRELPAELSELDQLVQRRLQLEKQRLAERSRLKQWQHRPRPAAAVTDSIQRTLDHIDEELAAIEDAIKHLLNIHPPHKRMVRRLRTIPGIGQKNVLHILLILHRFHVRTNSHGSAKGLVAFVGLDPTHFSSGSSIHRRSTISKMGDAHTRRSLYMGALGGVSGNNPLRHFYQRLVQRGKAKRLALVASARKILVWAFAIFTHKVDFDPTRHAISQIPS